MSPVAESILEAGWSPPRRQTSWAGLLVVASLGSTLSTVLELPPSVDRRAVRSWLKEWFQAWRAQASEADRSQPASFLYLILRRVPESGDAYGVERGGAV